MAFLSWPITGNLPPVDNDTNSVFLFISFFFFCSSFSAHIHVISALIILENSGFSALICLTGSLPLVDNETLYAKTCYSQLQVGKCDRIPGRDLEYLGFRDMNTFDYVRETSRSLTKVFPELWVKWSQLTSAILSTFHPIFGVFDVLKNIIKCNMADRRWQLVRHNDVISTFYDVHSLVNVQVFKENMFGSAIIDSWNFIVTTLIFFELKGGGPPNSSKFPPVQELRRATKFRDVIMGSWGCIAREFPISLWESQQTKTLS